MTKLIFTDGMTFETSGSLRKEKRSDGWYIVGNGKLFAVKDEKEADEYLKGKTEPDPEEEDEA